MADEAKYRVGMVSKMTGLSTHTLRMWEKRYATVLPKRTEAGGRLYTDADIERLRLLHKLVQSGHSIGGIAKLPDTDLRHMAQAPLSGRSNRRRDTSPNCASASWQRSSAFVPKRPSSCCHAPR